MWNVHVLHARTHALVFATMYTVPLLHMILIPKVLYLLWGCWCLRRDMVSGMCFQTLESIDLLPFFYYSFHLETKGKEISNVGDKHELDSENGLVSKVDLTLKNSHRNKTM